MVVVSDQIPKCPKIKTHSHANTSSSTRSQSSPWKLKIDSRGFTPWSHVFSLLCCQLVCSIGLNDICDSMRLNVGKLGLIRAAKPRAKNTLSNANKPRDPELMKSLFWQTFDNLMRINKFFGFQGLYKGLPRRFKRTIHTVDSSTISLVANCMDWAKHRRRKAAKPTHQTKKNTTSRWCTLNRKMTIYNKTLPQNAI